MGSDEEELARHSIAVRPDCPSSNRIYLWQITTPCLTLDGSIIYNIICKLPAVH